MADLQPTTKCERCGYDLRGISSKLCPECGAPLDFIIVPIIDPEQFHFAHAALEKENLISRFINPGGALGISAEISGDRSGWLWIRADEADRAEEILDELGIITSLGAKPIVDRAEPLCPKCDRALDANGPEVCEHCGTLFQWVDIESEPYDPTGHVCVACGYELTGNVSGNCPECGEHVLYSLSFGPDSESIPAAPVAESYSPETRNLSWHGISFCVAMLLLILVSLPKLPSIIRNAFGVVAVLIMLYSFLGIILNIAQRLRRS